MFHRKDLYGFMAFLLLPFLLTACSDPDRPTVSIQYAAAMEDIEQLERHIFWGTDVNASDESKISPLMSAISNEKQQAIEFLLENGADINGKSAFPKGVQGNNRKTKNINYGTPVVYATLKKDKNLLEYLLSNKARVDDVIQLKLGKGREFSFTAFHVAIMQSDVDMSRVLANAGADINRPIGSEWKISPLLHALREDEKGIVQLLLGLGVDLNHSYDNPRNGEKGITPLHLVVLTGDIELINQFLNKGANINAKTTWRRKDVELYRTPLDYKVFPRERKEAIRKTLIARGALQGSMKFLDPPKKRKPRSKGYLERELINAAYANKHEVVRKLIKRGADIEAIGLCGLSHDSDFGIWNQFIMAGSDVNCRGQLGSSPLFKLAMFGEHDRSEIELARKLIALGADVNSKGPMEGTPLHQTRNVKMALLLISSGAEVNAKDFTKMTPLDYAVGQEHEEVAKLLRIHGGVRGKQ